MEANTFPHNLYDLPSNSYVFDTKHSGIRTLPGHRISFVLPKWGKITKTAIFYGTVVFLDFDLDDVEWPQPEFNKLICIHGTNYRLPKDLEIIHDKGLKSAKLYREHMNNYVPGAEVHDAPRLLSLRRVHVSISVFESQLRNPTAKKTPVGKEDFITEEQLKTLFTEIRKATGRDVSFIRSVGDDVDHYVISIPINWVVQDITALETNNQKKEKILPQIVEPVAFPSIGTRIIYLDEDEERQEGIVSDFGVVENGDLIQVLLESGDDYTDIIYSNMYVDSEDKMHHPSIVRIMSPEKLADPKNNYWDDGCEIIRKSLSRWIPLVVEEVRILATEETEEVDRQGMPIVRTKWIRPEHAIGNPDLNVVSFQYGKVQIKGKGRIRNIVNSKKPYQDIDPENDVDIAAIKNFKDVQSFVCNAANGTMSAVYKVNGKTEKRKAFFDTRNGCDISTRRLPLFARVEQTKRVAIDTVTFRRVLGYISKNPDPNHQEQDIAIWTQVPQAFVNFYKYVASRGCDPAFENKNVAQVRQMMQSDEYPTLVEIYNFIQYGFSKKNPTATSEWSEFFATEVLGYPLDELRD